MKDLMDWAPDEEPAEDGELGEEETPPPPPRKSGLMDKKIQWLAEQTGVEDPEALVKLVEAVAKRCMMESGEEG